MWEATYLLVKTKDADALWPNAKEPAMSDNNGARIGHNDLAHAWVVDSDATRVRQSDAADVGQQRWHIRVCCVQGLNRARWSNNNAVNPGQHGWRALDKQ